jgi:uncharacterized pyridoxal phosphate-containing UPF0001 family protein
MTALDPTVSDLTLPPPMIAVTAERPTERITEVYTKGWYDATEQENRDTLTKYTVLAWRVNEANLKFIPVFEVDFSAELT